MAGAATVPSGMPAASTATERFRPGLPRSTGRRPATAPRLGDATVDGLIAQGKSNQPVIGCQHEVVERIEDAVAIPASRRRRSVVAETVSSAMR